MSYCVFLFTKVVLIVYNWFNIYLWLDRQIILIIRLQLLNDIRGISLFLHNPRCKHY